MLRPGRAGTVQRTEYRAGMARQCGRHRNVTAPEVEAGSRIAIRSWSTSRWASGCNTMTVKILQVLPFCEFLESYFPVWST